MQIRSLFQRPRRIFPAMEPARQRLVIAGLVASALLFLSGFGLAGYLWSLARQFPSPPYKQPSRLYGAATRLAPGTVLAPGEMVAELSDAGYREVQGDPRQPLPRGAFRRIGDHIAVHLRPFSTPEGREDATTVEAAFRGNLVARVWVAGRPAASARLEPPLLASFYDDDVEERRPVFLDDLPEPVIHAVLAAEDSGFYTHPGISPTGVIRALWVNLRGGELQQGGSTITQQVVKNVYLSSKRTLTRKAKEAVIAVALEARYGKRAILEAYLNEIYLGRSGPANLIGLGAAAQAYFGKDAGELSLAEAATLAGMIQAPADYSPITHPDKAFERRNWVLRRMAELGWIPSGQAQAAQKEPVLASLRRVDPRPMAPYFADAARNEAKERFGVDDLDGKGYLLFSTLRWRDQRKAEAAVATGLGGLEKGWESRRRTRRPLQAALVSVDPRDGAVLAWVGGRDWDRSQFDRVSQAHRQVGSAFKPVVYAAAFGEGVASPATLFNDSPINVRFGTTNWRPRNYDGGFHGWVTARTALEQSLNIPTVRVALQVGLHRVIELARSLGFSADLDPNPALALGAFEATPLEMARVYATLAAGGLQPPLHGLAAVIDPDGEPVTGEELPTPHRVLPEQTAYEVTSVLQGVIDHGTAAAARAAGVDGPLAGKTGTTNSRRDSWFAGYSPDRATVVWVGYDDNLSTQLSGARAALPIWSVFTSAMRPLGGYRDFAVPPGMVRVVVDPTTGQLATEFCPNRVTEVFPEWQAPTEPCQRHSPGADVAWADMSLGQPMIDPATGLPVDPAATEEPRYTITNEGLVITDPGGDEPITIGQAKTFPPQPVDISPEDEGVMGTDVNGAQAGTSGSILIRPVRKRPPNAGEPPAGATGPAGMAPPTEPSVVPIDGKPIGAAAGTPGAKPKPADPTQDGMGTDTAEPPPPPGPSLP
jgi:penicillin-binding protein 1B